MTAALTRYRVLAWVVGVLLVVLVCVAMPLRYLADVEEARFVAIAHGYLYMVYVLLSVDLLRRWRPSLGTSLLVLLAGTIPFLSFWVERRTTREVQALAQ